MCSLFGGGGDGGQQAAQAQLQQIQAQQANHDAAVNSDINSVNSAFAPFNDDYYNGFTKSYEDAQNPQLDKQYNAASSQLGATLAGTDRDMGSTGSSANANLYNTYGTARAGIGNSAVDATNQLRGTVNNAKNTMYGLAEQATDPLSMATQAQASAGSIVAPQSYPSMANVFGDVLSPLASGLKTSSQSTSGGGIGGAFQNFFAPTGGGSQVNI